VRVQLAVLVVDFDFTARNLVGQELVLLEDARNGRGALVAAAPRLDVRSFSLRFARLEGHKLFADHQHLLVLHLFGVVLRLENDLRVVLDLGLELFVRVRSLEAQ